jgi:hypothetical protein
VVAAGLVASFNRPGGNVTGVSLMGAELPAKRLELLAELVPQAGVVALLVNPKNSNTEPARCSESGTHKGLAAQIVKAGAEGRIRNGLRLPWRLACRVPVSVLAGDDDAGLVGVLAGRHGGIDRHR